MSTMKLDDAPFEITELPCGNGIIGLSSCPGLYTDDQRTFRHGGTVHRRDLEQDLSSILLWGATAVVTMLEEHEFWHLGVGKLGSRVVALGMQWYHLPVTDMSVPGDEFEELWQDAELEISRLLDNREKILIHCHHGHGRTGTLAACLLIDSGYDAEAAIRKVWERRERCVRTPGQQQYVWDYARRVGRVAARSKQVAVDEN